jgi:cell division protein FtsN
MPGPVWFAAGLALGLLPTFVSILQQRSPPSQAPQAAAPRKPVETPKPNPAQTPPSATQPTTPKYEFYTMLPEMEVAVPPQGRPDTAEQITPSEPVDPGTTDREAAQAPTSRGAGAGAGYLLQAGSFRSYADADGLKARLALSGIQAGIHKVVLAGGETWHRVRVGPFGDRQELDRVRKRLQQLGIRTLAVKVKG